MENQKIKPGDRIISPLIFDDDLKQTISKAWSYNLDISSDKFSMIEKPFKVCTLNDFLTSPLGTYDFRGEVLSLHHKKRGNDLMQLEESVCDLQSTTRKVSYSENTECIKQFCKEMMADFKPWLERVTGIKLNDTFSARTSRYTDTDFLLCHNDKVDDRCIAFILYLSEDWKNEYGGKLDLFESRLETHQYVPGSCTGTKAYVPVDVQKSILPKFNSLVFFEVTNHSFHAVSEILKDVSRFSVNGWFHGTITAPEPPARYETLIPEISPINIDSQLLPLYIKDSRLTNNMFAQIINKVIETKSFCGIKKFFKQDQFDALLQEIESDRITWNKAGPPDQMNYWKARQDGPLPEHLRSLIDIFKSVPFCKLLKKYTDLALVPDETTGNPKMTFELQRWNQGCYTILHDGNVVQEGEGDDVMETEEEEQEEEPERQLTNGAESSSYSVEDMLADITVDASSISSLLPLLNLSIQQARNDQPGPSSSSGTVEDGPGPSKRPRTEPDVATQGENLPEEMNFEENSESEPGTPGALDVVVYFHSKNAPNDTTLNYVDPRREDGVFLTLPIEDNTLFLVFREEGVVRHNAYVNHYCKGNFYSLVFSYKE